MTKVKVATSWLDGCSGCHMSFLDMDERLVELAKKIDLVYGPYVDMKEFPDQVDLALIEGSVSSNDDIEKARIIRAHTRILVSLGDCAVTGNVPAMRNSFGAEDTLRRGYIETASRSPEIPGEGIPMLLERVRPVHEVVRVDAHIPGCPPPADAIYFALTELLEGRIPDLSAYTRFGK